VAPPPNPADVQSRYGFVGQMARTVPELRGLLDRATREQWTTDRFLMAVANTNWWKRNGQAVREWQVLEATDPQTARDRKGHMMGDIAARAGRLGLNLNRRQLEQAFYFRLFSGGMSDENFEGYLYRTFFNENANWNTLEGKAAETAQQIADIGWSYGWRDADHYKESRRMLKTILSGEDTIEGFEGKMRAYAKSMFPALVKQIEGGMTVKEAAQAHTDRMAQLLEMSPTGIDLQNPLLLKALQARNEQGEPELMPVWKFEQRVREDPRWSKTKNAQESMTDFVTQLGSDWGFFAA
jgi:hypothetical protein